ncbi:MAG: 30S ribosomal protein S6 [Oscillospiraceae bacterium]|jgi:small subunit ribosomal protein S6|nr:30S ribosomal protein S6 [Oscillospiraceae bacterium]
MAKTTANYELLYIIDTDKTEEETAALVEKFSALISASGGEVAETDLWGKRRLAYPINDKPEGYYVLLKFTSPPDFPAELDRVMGITDGIMRSMITVIGE